MNHTLLCGLAAASLALPLGAQNVLVVDDDGGPGVTHTVVEDAIASASPGDVVLIRSGTYGSVLVDRPLSLVADTGANVELERIVARFDQDGELVLHGLRIAPLFGATLDLADLDADVWVQDCDVRGGNELLGAGGGPAFTISACRNVSFVDSVAWGGLLSDSSPSLAASVASSTVYLFGTQIVAADGNDGAPLFDPPDPGADALRATASVVHCERADVRGGSGGDGGPFCQGAAGGDGIVLAGASELRLLASTIAAGAGGSSNPPCAPGADGSAIVPGNGTVRTFADAPRSLVADPVLREQESATFDAFGASGDVVLLGLSLVGAPAFVPGVPTPLLVPPFPQTSLVVLGVVPSSGTLTQVFTTPDLAPAASARTLHAQAAAVDTLGRLHLSNARSITVLDASL